MPIVVIAVVSYLIGSIPSGYLAGRIAGIDIRKVGSGNIGATNVTRALGKRYGYPVFIADFSKGLGSVLLARFASQHYFAVNAELLEIVAGAFCVLGNAFPIWLRFRGGKGVATSAGMLFGLMPVAALVSIAVWLVTFQVTRYVSVASITAAMTLPVTVSVLMHFMKTNSPLTLYVSSALAAIVVLRHRSNLSRLMRGTEERFERRED
jgi:glycerol-3-phosphate acyltransferase PlsY